MKKSRLSSGLTITVKDKNNQQIIQFEVPQNTKMKNVHKILWDNRLEFETNKEKLIGFEPITPDPLQDYCLNSSIGLLKNNISIRPIYKDIKLQGLNKYKIVKCLATGGFSKVYLARSMHNGQFYAAKFVDKLKVSTDDKKILIMNEKKVNQIADYQFLVKMHQFIETDNFYVFIMDYCPGGELFYLLRKIKRMTEEQARIYFVETLLGIEYLHKEGIMYRDLKPENIMIDNTGHVKIADFGLAKYCRQKSYSFCGSIEYMSPEIVTNSGHSFEVDYYCLGALLYELLVGCPPFYDPDLSEHETKKNIAYVEVEFPQDFGLSSQVRDLIEKLLVKNPNQRLGHFGGAKEIMLHPWVGKINRAFIESKQFQVPYHPSLDRFNFDPEEVGMSEERFTTKIEHEYELINIRKAQNFKKEKRNSCQKYFATKKSPYAKKLSQSSKKNDKKATHESFSNFLTVGVSNQTMNLKNVIKHDLEKITSKNKLSKHKSPSFVSLHKKQDTLSKKSLKGHMYIPNKFHVLRTQFMDTQNSSTSSNHRILKKKKLMTEASEPFKDMSNEYMRFQKNSIQKQKWDAEKIVQTSKKQVKDKALLKKSSKLKIKKFPHQAPEKNFKYGKLFRQTCII